MSEQGYNGWTNYETWCVNLWIDNDRGWYEQTRELAIDCYRQASPKVLLDVVSLSRVDVAVRELESILKEQVEELNPLADEASIFSDLLGAALSEVDWRDIAEHWINDVAPEIDQEETEETEETDEGDDIIAIDDEDAS